MHEENFGSLLVVRRDYTLLGAISLEAASEAAKAGRTSIDDLIEEAPSVSPEEPLMNIINVMAEWRYITPVVDANNKVLGVVTRTALLSALAERNSEAGVDKAIVDAGSATA
jgi:glycine betaine/proline transport system ATP-binding protein